jgi:hypothetical protein
MQCNGCEALRAEVEKMKEHIKMLTEVQERSRVAQNRLVDKVSVLEVAVGNVEKRKQPRTLD